MKKKRKKGENGKQKLRKKDVRWNVLNELHGVVMRTLITVFRTRQSVKLRSSSENSSVHIVPHHQSWSITRYVEGHLKLTGCG